MKEELNMSGVIKNENGTITITEDVIANIAGLAAVENYGIVGMASRSTSDGLWQMLGRENVRKGVEVSMDNEQIVVDLYIMIQYGVSINAVAENAIHNIAYRIQDITGVGVAAVNVHVEGIHVQADQ